MKTCFACATVLEQVLDFGPMPIANAFRLPDDHSDEYTFDLVLAFCPNCRLAQLANHVPPQRMFHENYAFFTSTSRVMAQHFEQMANMLRRGFMTVPDPLVVELGSNDGAMLQHFAKAGVRHVGVEPSANVAAAAREKGVQCVTRFFDAALAAELLATHGAADVISGANVMCHIAPLQPVMDGVRLLLKDHGVLVFEDPYLGDILHKGSFDQIYDEHVSYFSATSVQQVFGAAGLTLFDVEPLPEHGGSMRYLLCKDGRAPSQALQQLLAAERLAGVDRMGEAFSRFVRQVELTRAELPALLKRLKQQGQRVVGYGATSKSTTTLNYCGIGAELLEFVTDSTPGKQGRLTPGTRIPVVAPQRFGPPYPDAALLLAWNHAQEIRTKETAFEQGGGRWVIYVPGVGMLP